ncbi:MAG: 2-(1,2-epoxy-1,2-dihydrophenyl)acetyl-CoA isomerase PaaG [Candidatus Symbiobacter sp.]|nr:2-(1,2-epoxy-1,2-dihydrophenyl)acetyl-CoA isomerase PaaG [Candidatus Symbiobacter sp.]
MTESTILHETRQNVAWLTLNRPDKLNSFNLAMHLAWQNALDRIEADKTLRAVMISGAGRGFCAGQDLGDRAVTTEGAIPDLGESVEKYYAPLVRRLRDLKLPVVAVVNGVAAGAGANLALACDIVIAAQSASFIQPFCRLGLIPDTGGSWILPRLLGPARAMGLTLLGDKLSARQAADWGLIWQCYPDDELVPAAEKLAAYFATAPTMGLAATKKLLNLAWDNSLEQQLKLEGATMRDLGYSDDYREGVAAFLAKRPPNFKGQ